MTVAQPCILLVDRGLSAFEERLRGYEMHRLWEHDDPLAYAAGDGQRAQAIVALGNSRLDPSLVEALPRLGLIACLASGYEGVDVAHARALGVEVTHSASVNHDDVADHVLAVVLASARRIVPGDRAVRDGLWGAFPQPRVRAVSSLKMGVVGLGVIGKSVARRLEVFGPQIAWWGRRPQPDVGYPRMDSLVELATWSDVLIVTIRADGGNRGLIDRSVIDALGPQGLLVNVSRGSVVDEDALIAALRDGRLGAAALDVFATEPTPPERWAGVDNAILTPHSAGGTLEGGPAMVALLLDNLRRYFAGETLATPVPAHLEP